MNIGAVASPSTASTAASDPGSSVSQRVAMVGSGYWPEEDDWPEDEEDEAYYHEDDEWWWTCPETTEETEWHDYEDLVVMAARQRPTHEPHHGHPVLVDLTHHWHCCGTSFSVSSPCSFGPPPDQPSIDSRLLE